ncbi:bifunctional metallophosphatase/5'-nucleotidase [Exiguobacterium flavidum]|uniref:bifunctional metallophosphatase/5'-nucleotidase n=1 Tax=Exiguobacterium flavidum TaxID=2184695 RepID=UPI000DF7D04F|nr:5'-nucleotidase C-terminal domain-containing protein [Exiguobacterium flavidum]
MTRLSIIHTNDIHSHFANFYRAATLIAKRQEAETLLLDGGDFADFKSIEYRGTNGLAAVDLLEAVGYDALTIGNNEMFKGADTLEVMASASRVPFLSANLFKADRSAFSGVKSSVVVEKNGLRILIVGVSPDMVEFNEGLGIHVSDYEEAIRGELAAAAEHDVCILLSHVGTKADTRLTETLEGIDVIISAHDHKLFPEARLVNGVIHHSAGQQGEHIGVIVLDVTEDGVKLVSSASLPTAQEEPRVDLMELMKVNKKKAIETLSRPYYPLEAALWHDVVEENPLSNLIADGLRDLLGCEIGLINSGIANAGLFDHVSERKLIEVSPSPLNPTSFEIQGKHLIESLEQSLDAQVCLAEGRGPGFRGRFVGRLHVSGMTVEHRAGRIERVDVGEHPIEMERWYTVATSDYLQRGSGYPALANNRNPYYRGDEIRDVIRLYGNQETFLERADKKRWIEQKKTPLHG